MSTIPDFVKIDAFIWVRINRDNLTYYLPGFVAEIFQETRKVTVEYEAIEDLEAENPLEDSLIDAFEPPEVFIDRILPRSNEEVDIYDLIDIPIFNEAEIMENIKIRYRYDEIYTYCGSTLISINPYAVYKNEYTVEKKEEYVKYLEKPYFTMKTIPPHIYSLAVSSVHEVKYDDIPDTKLSICLSGESGSGKTEAGIQMLDFIVYCYCKEPKEDSIEKRILSGHTLISAFGNAKTINNDSSSRFGKFINLMIDGDNHRIMGYTTKSYLFQKGLVTDINPGDTSFHIFYVINECMSSQMKQKCKIKDTLSSYKYMGESDQVITSISRNAIWESLISIFEIYKITEGQQEGIWKIISLVLNLGNVEYIKPEDIQENYTVEKNEYFKAVVELLDSTEKEIEVLLTTEVSYMLSDRIQKKLSGDACLMKRDAFAKVLYDSLFTWLVNLLNDTENLESKHPYENIGILDIPGFEIFQLNSLEQFCINYANEKTQNLFTEYYFREEKALFEREGLGKYIANFAVDSNDDIIILMDYSRPQGIIQHISSVSKVNERQIVTASGKLISTLKANFANNPLFEVEKLKKDRFSIFHTHEKVEYNTTAFVSRNIDKLAEDIYEFFMNKTSHMKDIVFQSLIRHKKDNKPSIAEKFSLQMTELINDLKASRCNFVRCIKPNGQKKHAKWDQMLVLSQMKFLGIERFLSMKKNMFPIRIDYSDFCNQFLELNNKVNEFYFELNTPGRDWRGLAQQTIEVICKKSPSEKDVVFGKKKLFISSSLFFLIETTMEEYRETFNQSKDKILQTYRRYKMRKQLTKFSNQIKRSKERASSLLYAWSYKFKDFQKYKKFTSVTEELQINWRIKLIQRKLRHVKEKRSYELSCAQTFLQRSRFLRERNSMNKIAKTFLLARFRHFFNLCISTKKILESEYDQRFWKGILEVIQRRAAITIQRHYRGFECRKKYSYEVSMIKLAKRRFIEKRAATDIQRVTRGSALRKKLKKFKKGTVYFQKMFRRKLNRSAYLQLRKSTIKIQRFWRRYAFRMFKYEFLIKEKIDSGEYVVHKDLAKKELQQIFSANYVDYIKISERLAKCAKRDSALSFVPTLKPFSPPKFRLFSYVLDIDPVVDPNDTFLSSWAMTFMLYFRHLRDDYEGNLMHLAVGDSHSLAVSDNSYIYHWGSSDIFQLAKFEPFMNSNPREIPMKLHPHRINYVQTGSNHTLLYSKSSGTLYAYGDNEKGQLGLGHYNMVKGIINLSHLLKGKKAVHIESKVDSNIICLEDGTVIAWPLQVRDLSFPEPQRIRIPNEKIKFVSLGYDFTMFLTANGRVYSMGKSGDCGELGQGDFAPREEPTLIKKLHQSGEIITQISCGFKHVIARNHSGKIFTWGWGERGQLGQETDRNLPFPRKILFKADGGFSYSSINIQAGYRCSYALLEGRRIFFWGSNGRISKQLTPIEYTHAGYDEIYMKKRDFKPLKICCSWSKSISVTYVIVGDCRAVKDKYKHSEQELFCKNIANQWQENYFDSKPKFDKKLVSMLDLTVLQNQDYYQKMKQIRMMEKTIPDRVFKRTPSLKQNKNYRIDATVEKEKKEEVIADPFKSTYKPSFSNQHDSDKIADAEENNDREEISRLKQKLESLKNYAREILKKDPDTWTNEDIAFLKSSKEVLKNYQK